MRQKVKIKFEAEFRQAIPTVIVGIHLDKHHSACQGTGKAFIFDQIEDCYGCEGTGLVWTDDGVRLLRWLREALPRLEEGRI